MKKVFIMATGVAMAAMAMTSCNNGGSSKLSDNVDSLTYDIGVARADGLKQHMTMQLGVDSAYIDEFIKGMKEGALNEADPKKDAYMEGMKVGKDVQQLAKALSSDIYEDDSTKTVNINALLSGLIDGLKGTAGMDAETAYKQFMELYQPIIDQKMEKMFGDNKKAGEDYLAKNAKAEGVTVLPSGVQYKVLVAGDGALPTDSTKLTVNYEGRLVDGTVFDSSYERNTPFEVNMAYPRVIEGWVEILKLMPAGSKWEVAIPYDKAYGTQNQGQIKPFSTLIFTIEVMK